MKKLSFILLAFIFSLTINAQSPTLTFTNVTGSNSITCSTPVINYMASVNNYTGSALTYTWVSLSAAAGGTNVFLTNPGTYTLTAFNTVSNFSLTQVFSIGVYTTAPISNISPLTQSITCNLNSVTNVTATSSPTINITHQFVSPYGATFSSNAATSVYNPGGPGTFTHVIINAVNGCSTAATFSVYSSSSFPTFSVTSPQQFIIGCSTMSVATIQLTNAASTIPPGGGPVSYTVLTPFSSSSYTPGGLTSYTANAAGTYTAVILDNTNFCETHAVFSIVQNTVGPNININVSTQTLSCYTPSVLMQASSSTTNVTYSWSFPGPGTATTSAVTVSTIPTATFTGSYSLIVTGANSCSSTTVIPFYQNINVPTVNIFPSGALALTCNTPSINIVNSSISNIPSSFPHPLPVTAIAWYGPVPQASVANTSGYLAFTGGPYTVIVQDQNNGCTSTATKNISDIRSFPIINPLGPFNINCPAPTATIYPNISGSTSGFTYSWTAPANATLSSSTAQTITVNAAGDYTITVNNQANGCSSTATIAVSVCAGIYQNSLDNEAISIYPNPTNGLLTFNIIENNSYLITVFVYSASGRLVQKQELLVNSGAINLQNEAAGLYLIYIKLGEKAIKTFKVVKN